MSEAPACAAQRNYAALHPPCDRIKADITCCMRLDP